MLDEKMAAADLAVTLSCGFGTTCRCAVMQCHIQFEFLRVRVRGRFPARFLIRGIEIVRKVLGVRMANLPPCWKTGLYLLDEQQRQSLIDLSMKG